MGLSWYCIWVSGHKLEFCVQLEPGCVAVIAQQTKTIQEGMVLTPKQVTWIITTFAQIMQNSGIKLPLRLSQYSAKEMSSLF